MAQGKYKKLITKKARKGNRGYPVATVAYYGPSNLVASKLVCGIVKSEHADVEPMKKWFSDKDIRKSEKILGEVLAFIDENEVSSVVMVEEIIGCSHEEGIDYPEGESCPTCSYWKGRDRFTHEMFH
ncbi:MAG: hypothetical protein OEY89_09820 [Gammaproteobacteria bacterium]|nr:hypothetical protein [Gammaproteobacteria bacterium]